MTVKFYIASGYENRGRVAEAIRYLEEAGYQCAYDWTKHEEGPDCTTGVKMTFSRREIAACREADVVIVWFPGGKGTHIEIGAALASGTEIWMTEAPAEIPFYTLCDNWLSVGLNDTLLDFVSEVRKELERYEAQRMEEAG